MSDFQNQTPCDIQTSYKTFRLARHVDGHLQGMNPTRSEHITLHQKYLAMAADYEDRAYESFNALSSGQSVTDEYMSMVDALYHDVDHLYTSCSQLGRKIRDDVI